MKVGHDYFESDRLTSLWFDSAVIHVSGLYRQQVFIFRNVVQTLLDISLGRLTPSTIFNAPVGSIISQNNIANQYSSADSSAYVSF